MNYFDSEGNPTSLNNLVRSEPDWAANRISFMNDQVSDLKQQLANSVLKRELRALSGRLKSDESIRFVGQTWNLLDQLINKEG